MSNPAPFQPRPMTAIELGLLIGLSRGRIYQLIKQGRFPAPMQGEYSSRTYFSADQVMVIINIKKSGIALDGKPILFNKVVNPRKKTGKKGQWPSQGQKANPILEYLEGLGLAVTAAKLDRVLAQIYPDGWQRHPQEEVVQKAYQGLLADSQ